MATQFAEKPAASPKSAREMLKGVKVVDADTHITEWPDLWTSRAPAAWKDLMPQRKTVDGVTRWMLGDYELAQNYGYSAIMKDGSKLTGMEFFNHPLEDATPGAYDLQARLEYLDENGLAAQIAYTNLLGFGGGKSMKVDEKLRMMAIEIQNDAMAELQVESNNRVYPMAMLPWWNLEASVKEATRCADMGLRGVNIHASPQDHGLPDLGDPHWAPLWELCEGRGLPINFHVGFSQGADGWETSGVFPSLQGYEKYAISTSMLFTGNMITILNLLMTDIFRRHPGLKFTSVESGVGWVAPMLENLDYQVRENLPGKPVSIIEDFKDHFYICYWAERDSVVETVNRIGADNILFETDYPHPTCLYPDPIGYHQSTLERLSPEDRGKIFGRNAEKLYKLDLSQAPAAS